MKLKLEVGEPRDFNAGDNTNVIVCAVVEGSEGFRVLDISPTVAARIHKDAGTVKEPETVTEWWFAGKCEPVTYEGSTFTSLLLVPRYKTKKSPVEALKEGQKMVLHCIWRQDGGAWDLPSIEAAREGRIEIGGMLVVSAQILE